MKEELRKLIFVYNAKSGRMHALVDMAHKIFSPKTYPCHLCDITYGVFSIRKEWEEFLNSVPVPCVFLHSDEFEKMYPGIKIQLPAVCVEEDRKLSECIAANELEKYSLQDLMKKISELVNE